MLYWLVALIIIFVSVVSTVLGILLDSIEESMKHREQTATEDVEVMLCDVCEQPTSSLLLNSRVDIQHSSISDEYESSEELSREIISQVNI